MEKTKGRSATGTVTEAADDVSHYLDENMVEQYEDDIKTIDRIRKLSDTTMDKLTFTIFSMNVILSAYMGGCMPQYYYIVYTAKAILLISYRVYSYKKMKLHYFLLGFCYFTNFLVLLYLWLPSYFNKLRGMLFPAVFGFSNGPVMASIVLWRGSLVPHSNRKMTALFMDISPGLTLWGIRWFSTKEQGFPFCANPGPEGCTHTDIWEIVVYPLILYCIWQLGVTVMTLWRKKKIEQQQYLTIYRYMIEKTKGGTMYRMCGIFGPKYRKPMFIVWQFIFTTFAMLLAYPCYHSREFNIVLASVMLTVACYNGASFYIDVFSQRYYKEVVEKQKKT